MGWSGGIFSRLIAGGWTADKVTTPAITAARHDVNDDDLATGINACVPADGSKAMTGDLNMDSHKVTNLTNGSNAQDAVSFSQMNSAIAAAMPAGIILPYGAAAAPTGYLLCNGAAVSRTTYATLFAILGTTYGSGDNSTTFNLPDLRGRKPVGVGTGYPALGNSGGTVAHTHAGPSHTHDAGDLIADVDFSGGGSPSISLKQESHNFSPTHNAVANGGMSGGSLTSQTMGTTVDGTTAAAGTGVTGAASDVEPYAMVNYIIKT